MEDLIKREDALKELRLDFKDVIYIDKTETFFAFTTFVTTIFIGSYLIAE